MPITSTSTITPLSKYFTYEDIISEAMIITGSTDNENIDLDNIRVHSNIATAYLVELLNAANKPFYGVWMVGNIEPTLHPTGLHWIDMSITINNLVPIQHIDKLYRINIPNQVLSGGQIVPDGNISYKDLGMIIHMNNNQNVQHKFTVSWNLHGADLLLFIGNGITVPSNPINEQYYAIKADTDIVLSCFRKPILDNTRVSIDDPTANYRDKIDLPDQYVDLLVKMVQKRILEQLRETIPQALEAQINQGLMNVAGSIQQEIQTEVMSRQKSNYGPNQRPFYGTGQ